MLAASGGQSQVFLNLHGGGSAHHGVLEHTAQERGPFEFGQTGNILTVNKNGAAVHGEGAGNGIEHSGFSRTVAADYGDKIPLVQGQTQIIQRCFFVDGAGEEGFRDVFQLKNG